MTDLARWASTTALALSLVIFVAERAAFAHFTKTDSGAGMIKRAQLEKGLQDITEMLRNDPRYSRGRTPQQIKDGVEFVTGNVLFVLAHETGHALISVFQLPVLGREEDAGDSLATIIALKMGSFFADTVVVNAARGWFLSDRRDRKDSVPFSYYDEHGLDVQRAFNIVCLMVGGAPEKFMSLAQEVKLPKERQDTCRYDFSNAEWSWEEALKPHLRKPDEPRTKIDVNYAPTREYSTLAQLGRKLQILETVAEWLSDDFAWKAPISLEMRECGRPNARWLPLSKQIIVCYEIIQEFVQLHRKYGQAALMPGTPRISKSGKIVVVSKPNSGTRYRSENPGGGMFKSAKKPKKKM